MNGDMAVRSMTASMCACAARRAPRMISRVTGSSAGTRRRRAGRARVIGTEVREAGVHRGWPETGARRIGRRGGPRYGPPHPPRSERPGKPVALLDHPRVGHFVPGAAPLPRPDRLLEVGDTGWTAVDDDLAQLIDDGGRRRVHE